MNDFGSDGLKCRLQGMAIRDEFLCPIMYQLFRDPVIAQDGHTYERTAIEKWFERHHTSPRTGHLMTSKLLIPNLNIHKLIQDFIAEGGIGLYTRDGNHANRLFYVFAQKILMLQCLGPPESSWNLRTFEVTPRGCIGGRRQPTIQPPNGMECIQFHDCTTVSRSHFEIRFDSVGKYYQIRDIGSAGGTFIRIPHGKKKLLTLGTMLLLGKHQFIVSDVTTNDGHNTSYDSDPKTSSEKTRWFAKLMEVYGEANNCEHNDLKCSKESDDSLNDLVGNADELLKALSAISTDDDRVLIEAKVRKIRDVAAEAARIRRNTSDHSSDDKKIPSSTSASASTDYNSQKKSSVDNVIRSVKKLSSVIKNPLIPNTSNDESGQDSDDNENHNNDDDEDGDGDGDHSRRCRLVLTCFAPEGSPLVGKSFGVDHTGATIGRKLTNTIALYLNQNGVIIQIDSAISSEHARIELDRESGSFFLSDGSGTKPSTNGSWFRLSPPGQKSAPHEIRAHMEILIGTIRFQAHERTTLTEEAIEEGEDTHNGDDGDEENVNHPPRKRNNEEDLPDILQETK